MMIDQTDLMIGLMIDQRPDDEDDGDDNADMPDLETEEEAKDFY